MDTLFRQHGYLSARILEFINEQDLISVTYDDLHDITQETDEQLDKRTVFMEKLIGLIISELNILFLIIQLKMKTLKVEIDEESNQIQIHPPTRQRDIQRSLTFKLSHEDHEWNSVFGAINFPRRGITFNLGDSSGIGEVSLDEIEKKWDIFKEVWFHKYRTPLSLNVNDFFIVWECIKWLNISIPFSENDIEILVQQVGPGSENIVKKMIQTFKTILPDIKKLKIVNSIPQVKKEFFHMLFKYGLGWKYTSSDGTTYFHLSCQFAGNNFIRNAFEAFFYKINDPGPFYEEEIKNRINLINIGLVTLRGNRDYLVGYQPIKQDKSIETINNFNIQVLERNYDITSPNVTKYNISADGEIDLIIYSNKNLFLLEAKSFFSKKLSSNIQYASDQCTKYREWIDTPDFDALIEKHKIQNLNKIFILILTNRQEEKLYVKSNKSGLYFPIISFSILPLLLIGFYTIHVSNKNIITRDLFKALMEILNEKLNYYKIIQAKSEEYDKFREIWSKYFFIILNSTNLPANFDFSTLGSFPFDSSYIVIDYKIENNGNWELSEQIPIWENDGYTFYLITEIGNVKHSYVCKNCKSVWLYYFPDNVEMRGRFYKSLQNSVCIKCQNKIANQKALDVIEIANKSTLPMVFIKNELGESKMLGDKNIKDELKNLRNKIPF